MVLSPMGPVLMAQLSIDPKQLGYLVSAYTFSAALFGLLSAMIIDRFDRRSALALSVALLAVAEIACALSPNYTILFICRMACGAFAGVIGALLNTIIGDAIAPADRGKALGQVMSAFAFASVAGVPIGLYFASQFGWHAPFIIVLLCLIGALVATLRYIPSLTEHLAANHNSKPSLFSPIKQVLKVAQHRKAYVLMTLVVGSSFLVIPYISVYNVANVHLPANQLSLVYLVGGAMALVASRFIGQWTDKFGVKTMFNVLNIGAIVSVLLITNLTPVPLPIILLVTTLFFIVVPTRMVPSMALMNAAVVPHLRGTFMSLNSALQSLVQGVAAFTAASIISRNAQNELVHFGWVGGLSVVMIVLAIFWSRTVKAP